MPIKYDFLLIFNRIMEIVLECSYAYFSSLILKVKLEISKSKKHNLPQTQKSPSVPNIWFLLRVNLCSYM